MALVRRSDSIAVKSEGTRVIVNAVKSLWTIDTAADPALAKRKKEAMDILVTPAHTAALAQLIGRSRKYPVLINEGVMALSLMSTHTNGGERPSTHGLLDLEYMLTVHRPTAQASSSSTRS